jgi:hypothetical protein
MINITGAMVAMPSVHEDMHERAEQKNQIWLQSQNMGLVFSQEKEPCHSQKNY